MIRGRVDGLRAVVDVAFRLLGRPALQIEFVVDTGFEGALTLPPAAVASLGLPYRNDLVMRLADGTRRLILVHEATISWDGQDMDIAVLAMDGTPLLGTSLLDGFNLNVDFTNGGAVTIQPLP